MAMDIDEAIALCGDRSKWHMLMFTILGITSVFPSTWHMLAIVFIGGVPRDMHCKVPNDDINDTIPFIQDQQTGEWKRDQCHQYGNQTIDGVVYDNASVTCQDGYTFHTDFESTIVMEWELVCTRDYLKDLSQTIFALGVMAGAIVFTTLADAYGRKPVFLAVNWVLLIVGTVTAFIQDYYAFLFLRFLGGALQQGITLSGFVLCCEIFAADMRTFAGIIVQVFWGFAMMIQAGIAYGLRDWRDFQLAITLPMIVTLGGYWYCPESMGWQAANQKTEEAERQLRKIAKFNGIEDYPKHPLTGKVDALMHIDKRLLSLGQEVEDDDEDEQSDEEMPKRRRSIKDKILQRRPTQPKEDKEEKPKVPKETLLTIFKHRKLRNNLFVMCSLWFVTSLVYYGLNLSTGDLAGDRYMNFTIGGVVEGLAYLCCYFALKRFGRRKPLCVYQILAGVCLLISVFVPAKIGETDTSPVSILFNMLGRFNVSSSFATIFLYAGELFPVNVRNSGIGVCSVAARIAGMIAPFSSLMIKKVYWLPGVIFAALSFTVGVLTLLLPETQGRALPQSIQEMMDWDRKRGRAKSFDVRASLRDSRRQRRLSSRRGTGGGPAGPSPV